MASRKAILSLGLGKYAKGVVPGIGDVVRTVQDQWNEAHQLGFDYGILDLDPDDQADTLKQLESELKRREWDGVLVGGAVRSRLELTVLFEKVINLCIQEMKPGAKLMFSSAPDAIVETLGRNFPELAESS